MNSLFLLWFGVLVRLFRGRGKLVLENLALRQQLNILKRRHPRPRLDLFDKLFWVIAQQFWSTWKEALIVVTPETVGSVASGRLSFLLAVALQGPKASREEKNFQGGSGSDLPNGCREPKLGSAAHLTGSSAHERSLFAKQKKIRRTPFAKSSALKCAYTRLLSSRLTQTTGLSSAFVAMMQTTEAWERNHAPRSM
jgi:hypothetical protein